MLTTRGEEIFPGTHPRTTEAITGKGADIYKVRTIRRNRVELRWCGQTGNALAMTVASTWAALHPKALSPCPRGDFHGRR